MLLMQANPLRGIVGGGWTLEIETFLSPVKYSSIMPSGECHFTGLKTVENFSQLLPFSLNDEIFVYKANVE